VKVFFSGLEVLPLEGSGMPREIVGALVHAYVAAQDAATAERRILEHAEEKLLRIIHLEGVEEYDSIEWDSADQQAEHDACADRASASGDVIYSTFYGWESE
jgi:hypothetical protein